jgi:dihydroorotase
MKIFIQKATVIDPGSSFHGKTTGILIENGIIARMSDANAPADAVVVAHDELMVSPGWVDLYADYAEPGYEQKETIQTGLKAAAAGGFTDVFAAPNTNPVTGTKALVEYMLGRAHGNLVNLHPMGAATQQTDGKDLAEMMDMRQSGARAFTDGRKPIQNAGLMLKALEYVRAFDGVIVQVPNDVSLSAGGLMNEGVLSTQLGMPGIPAIAETMMVYRDLELLRYTGSRLHITGISTAESVEMIRRAKAEGLQVTCSVTPYHLALNENELRGYNSAYKVNPPLRSERDRQALVNGLASGTIDCIATHHLPQEWDAKTREFEYASSGMALQESAFQACWQGVKEVVSLDRLVEAMTTIPRDIFGMEQAIVAEGQKAVLTLFTPSGTHTLAEQAVRSKSRNNPFIGKALPGRVVGIVNNNQYFLN